MTPPAEPIDTRKLATARVFATSRYPYLASALFAAPVTSALDSGTIAVDDRWRIAADPLVVQALDVAELGRLLVHLVSHLLRDHAKRALAARVPTDGDPIGWNRAGDAEINDDLAPNRMVPESAPDLPSTFDAKDGELAEHYYEITRRSAASAAAAESNTGDGRPWDCGSGCDGVPRPWDPDAGGDDRAKGVGERDASWLRLAVAWETQKAEATEPGTVAGGWLRWAESVLPSRTDWRRVLAAEINAGVAHARGMVDYSYRRPSRRADASPSVLLPALERPLPSVAIVCDTSGSMSGRQLGRVLVEIEALLERVGLRDADVRVLSCDHDVQSIRRIRRASQIELVGGGGTDMGEGIAQASALRPRPSIIVVLTDGMTPWPEKPPRGIRVVVALIEEGGARFGGRWGYFAFEPPPWARVVRISDLVAEEPV